MKVITRNLIPNIKQWSRTTEATPTLQRKHRTLLMSNQNQTHLHKVLPKKKTMLIQTDPSFASISLALTVFKDVGIPFNMCPSVCNRPSPQIHRRRLSDVGTMCVHGVFIESRRSSLITCWASSFPEIKLTELASIPESFITRENLWHIKRDEKVCVCGG